MVIGAQWFWEPAREAAPSQGTIPLSPGIAAIHEACVSGDAKAMREAVDALTEEDWAAMARHIDGGHHGGTEPMMRDHREMKHGDGGMMD